LACTRSRLPLMARTRLPDNIRTAVGETKDISMDLAADQGPQVDESGRALTAEQKAPSKRRIKQVAAMAKNKALNDAFTWARLPAAISGTQPSKASTRPTR